MANHAAPTSSLRLERRGKLASSAGAALVFAGTALSFLTGTAHADPNIRDCGTTTTVAPSSEGGNGWTTTTDTTKTQTPACNSNSTTNQTVTTDTTVRNKGGNAPGGHN